MRLWSTQDIHRCELLAINGIALIARINSAGGHDEKCHL